jgi:hypothetical protein
MVDRNRRFGVDHRHGICRDLNLTNSAAIFRYSQSRETARLHETSQRRTCVAPEGHKQRKMQRAGRTSGVSALPGEPGRSSESRRRARVITFCLRSHQVNRQHSARDASAHHAVNHRSLSTPAHRRFRFDRGEWLHERLFPSGERKCLRFSKIVDYSLQLPWQEPCC